jgi:acyl-[acyl-carrier-protein]-phospholipid O-acyltransferase/long-chain-fatty-acid--[acyl-carrier-protein] ligase
MVPHETVEDLVNKALGHGDDARLIAIVGVPDEAKGEALVILSSNPDIDLQALRVKLTEEGIPALWIPKKIVDVPEIPILASGKLDIKGCETIARAAE